MEFAVDARPRDGRGVPRYNGGRLHARDGPLEPSSPSDISSLLEAASRLQRDGRHADALGAFENCVALAPGHAGAHLGASVACFQLARWEHGIAHARVAAAVAPGDPAGWFNIAHGWREAGRPARARPAALHAVRLAPRLADAWNLMGLVALDEGSIAEARDCFRRAIEISPALAAVRVNLANCDQRDGLLDEALQGYAAAERMQPRDVSAAFNRGHLWHTAKGDLPAAIAAYREAIDRDPAFAKAHHNLSHALFLAGDFAQAWQEYRWRPPRLRHEAALAVRGLRYEPAADSSPRRLQVLGEQGPGDLLFFLRFAPRLRELGFTLDFLGEVRLAGMLRGTGLFESIATAPEPPIVPGAVLAGDLPLLLPDGERSKAFHPLSLAPDPARLAEARRRLQQAGEPPYIALAWRAGVASTGPDESLQKEIPIAAFGTALRGKRATWVSVQREPREGETEALAREIGQPVHDFSAINENLDEALAYMSAFDEWAGVSNTNLHLRSAAGRGAHVLVPFPPEWRWMAEGASPWFPTVSVHRQRPDGSWAQALAGLARGLPD